MSIHEVSDTVRKIAMDTLTGDEPRGTRIVSFEFSGIGMHEEVIDAVLIVHVLVGVARIDVRYHRVKPTIQRNDDDPDTYGPWHIDKIGVEWP